MADPILFEPTPVEIHLQTPENEAPNSHSLWHAGVEFSQTEALAEIVENTANFTDVDGLPNLHNENKFATTRVGAPSNFGDLWRRHDFEDPVAPCQINPAMIGPHEMCVKGECRES